ncbi:ATP-binding protein [Amycolatopsis sp. NBC_00348]|uniref:ATP-binding protein n=1 Tax=Amycolatopsis sp. NBC_00348 TaxID=2975956 RepID=UPI002E266989
MTSDDRYESPLTAQAAVHCDMSLTDRDDLPQAHQWTRAVLEGQLPDIDQDRVVDVLLVLDELASNALLHGAGRRRIGLTVDEEHALLEVVDESTRPAIPDGGLGLQLVKSVSAGWGQQIRDGRKTVWARVALS